MDPWGLKNLSVIFICTSYFARQPVGGRPRTARIDNQVRQADEQLTNLILNVHLTCIF